MFAHVSSFHQGGGNRESAPPSYGATNMPCAWVRRSALDVLRRARLRALLDHVEVEDTVERGDAVKAVNAHFVNAHLRKSRSSVGTQVRLSLASYSTSAPSVTGATANELESGSPLAVASGVPREGASSSQNSRPSDA